MKAAVVAAVLCTADAVQVGVQVKPRSGVRTAPQTRRKAAVAAGVAMLASGAQAFQLPPAGSVPARFPNLLQQPRGVQVGSRLWAAKGDDDLEKFNNIVPSEPWTDQSKWTTVGDRLIRYQRDFPVYHGDFPVDDPVDTRQNPPHLDEGMVEEIKAHGGDVL